MPVSTQNKDDIMRWYAMRVTYNREMTVKQMLDVANIANYIPLRHVVKYKNGIKVNIAQPAIRGLFFVNCDKASIMDFKRKIPYFQFMTRKEGNKNKPIIVPEDQMESFIKATSVDESLIEYLNPSTQDFTKGCRVRIHGGELDGVEGKFMRVSGKRAKRLLIQVENVMAVAIDVSALNYIEVIKQ